MYQAVKASRFFLVLVLIQIVNPIYEQSWADSSEEATRASQEYSHFLPIEENLPGRKTVSTNLLENAASLTAHTVGYGMWMGTFGALWNANEVQWIWSSRSPWREKLYETASLKSVSIPAALGAVIGFYHYSVGTFSLEKLDRSFWSKAPRYRAAIVSGKTLIHHEKTLQVQKIFLNLVREAKVLYPQSQLFPWDLVVVDDDKIVNAFCLPGGVIAVYTGILEKAENEAGLAAILGHEIGHALAKHAASRIRLATAAETVTDIIKWIASLAGIRESSFYSLTDILDLYFLQLPFNRKHELEADLIGLVLMARAGYDPIEAARFWEKMDQGGVDFSFLSTHPSSRNRKVFLENYSEKVMPLLKRAPRLITGEIKLKPLK